MKIRKSLNILVSLLVLTTLLFGSTGSATAMPSDPTDESKVPHYFGPYPNWANSPFTLPNATVEITDPTGTGSGATAIAQVDPVTQGIASIQITSPGSGYTSADVIIHGGDGNATATATLSTSGVVTSVNIDAAGGGYASPQVSFTAGGGTGTIISIGNPLVSRAFATDYATAPGTLGPVLVILKTTMPTSGQVTSIQYFNQATTGGSPTPSAGNLFHAYVLRPTANPNEYSVLWDSGELTVPAIADPVGVIETIPVPNIAVTTGDTIALYGEGIPVDDAGTGTDVVSYPANAAPTTTFTLGGAEYPILSQTRTYSFGAQVLDLTVVSSVVNPTGTAYGGVDAVEIIDAGSNYTMPTVEFDLPDAPDGVPAKAHAEMDASGTITAVVIDNAGSGYLAAPGVAIHNGTLYDPIAGATLATATTTLKVTSVTIDTFGSGYVSAPMVTFSDTTGIGTGAAGTALMNTGAVTDIIVTNPGSGYLTVGIRKFIDNLPGLCAPADCTGDKYIPLAVPEAKTYNGVQADEYVIGLVQYRTSFSSDLPPTLVRGYVQIDTGNIPGSKQVPLQNELLDGTKVDTGYIGVTPPQWLGPVISATKNKPVRIVFRNLLPTGSAGDLFLPTDSSLMGSGMGPMAMAAPIDGGSVIDEVRNPMCSEYPKGDGCFKDNRATLHLHGGTTPWISDGTAHQWITPAGETTAWPEGVSVSNVPDMLTNPADPTSVICKPGDDGCQTFFYTNQQSARLLFYHDHSWGITRLNVYAGEAAGYLISDNTEKALVASGAIPADQIPLIVQDRTFVPNADQLALEDPTWDAARWGTKGSFWYHHVYMPAQNPGDPSGMSAYGRWMYGPWFWPPAAATVYGPIDNPYYDSTCNLDDPATWQYQTDPFCEPKQIPGTPNISVGMEQFNDTPIVNGVAYPKITLEPKSYRLRMLNAANDRFFNFQWYVADPNQGDGKTEVALKAAELEAAQTDPNVFPTPDTTVSLPGPDWIQIGTEGGFLPAPVVVDGQQPTTWITDPTRFDVGNVDKHSLLLAPAERADVIVDFSRFAGKTLILYNDAPAAFPARVASYDYYTGAPDLSPVGAPTILPGYGPNTRTIMQVTIAGSAAPAFNLTKLQTAFRHNASGTGAFESGQHPIIVGQAAYNSAYGTAFAASSNCNAPGSTVQRCDGLVRVNDTSTFGFNTLKTPTVKMTLPLQPKAIHDEMNSTTFDEYGRMQANLGVEAQPPSPGAQNVTLYPFVNPATEIINGTNLPTPNITYDTNGLPASEIKITPISDAGDGTQIWRITHNGVDTHPIHFHLYDVQVLNRVTWDNIIIPPDATELGWKDTVRISPLEDTIVALRPIIPNVPFEVPNAIRMLNPMMPAGSTAMFNNVDPQGNPTNPITNQLVNFGWEYVYHCHILSHEEMDMMRPVSLALPPAKTTWPPATQTPPPFTSTGTGNNRRLVLNWNDNSITETAFVIQSKNANGTWSDVGTVLSPLGQPNTHGPRTFTVPGTYNPSIIYVYRIVAQNTVGYGAEFPNMTVQSISDPLIVGNPPVAPIALTATLQAGPQVSLTWTDNATNEAGFVVERSINNSAFVQIATPPARNNTGSVTFVDRALALSGTNDTYAYRVAAVNLAGNSAYVSTSITVPGTPVTPSNLQVVNGTSSGNSRSVVLTWTDNSLIETGFTIQRATNSGFTGNSVTSVNVADNATTYTWTGLSRNTAYYFRIRANNGTVIFSGWVNASPYPIVTLP